MTTDTAERDRQIIADQARDNLALRRELTELRCRYEAAVKHVRSLYATSCDDEHECDRLYREKCNDRMQFAMDEFEAAITTRNEARNGHKDCTVPEYLAVGTVLPWCDPQSPPETEER